MERGNIVKWHVKQGDEVKAGDSLADIETDKATLIFENQDEGFIAKLLVPDGSKDVPVGTPVAIVVEDQSHVASFASFTIAAPSSSSASPTPAAAVLQPPSLHRTPMISFPLRMTPDGLRISEQPHGPVSTKPTTQSVLPPSRPPTPATKPPSSTTPASSVSSSSYTDTPNSQIRKVIASRLVESKVTIPALYFTTEVSLNEVTKFRASLLDQGIKVSLNDIVLKSLARALSLVPEANVFWDYKKNQVLPFSSVDISVAVATDKGLITPIVKGADKKSLSQISRDVKDLASRARESKLKPEEFIGGSFTVSNLGMMGVRQFAAIINPPQAGILAIGTSQQRTVLSSSSDPSAAAGGPSLTVEAFMEVTLSADARVYDGDLAARLLGAFREGIQGPSRLVI